MKKHTVTAVIVVLIMLSLLSCDEKYLDVKSDKSMVIPTSLKDFQAMLDNRSIMNLGAGPLLGEIGSDDYYVERESWLSLSSPYERNGHIWAEDIFQGQHSSDWNNPSLVILYANISLEGLEKIQKNTLNETEWNNVKGTALFFRALSFFHMSQLFCKTFIAESASQDSGIPLRLDSDVTVLSRRATVLETYSRIIEDLKLSATLLPAVSSVKIRPSRAAANALLSRVYLIMGDYKASLEHAESSLQDYDKVIDFNSVDTTQLHPFRLFNDEVIFHCNLTSPAILTPPRMKVSNELYKDYKATDIRKSAWFNKLPNGSGITYKGSYNSSLAFFSGLSVGEVYFNRIESLVRLGNIAEAQVVLNRFLKSRFKPDDYEPINIDDPETLLNEVLVERRKELAFRAIRWSDLRRLNLEESRKKTIMRVLGLDTFWLTPNSPRYVLPIPDAVIKQTEMPQNLR